MKVARGEQGQLEAAANTAVGLGKAVVVDPVRDIFKQNADETAARAKSEGRQVGAVDIAKTGAQASAEIAGHFTGIKGLAEATADAETFKERGDWAAQKAALDQYVVANTKLGEKKIRGIQNELEQLIASKDVNDPAVRARVDELLAAGNGSGQVQTPRATPSSSLLTGGGADVAQQCQGQLHQAEGTDDDYTLAALPGQWRDNLGARIT